MTGARCAGFVAALTGAVLAVVAVLAYQAAGGREAGVGSAALGAEADAMAGGRAGPPVPEDSGTGKRVVYAPGERRVWLVGEGGRVLRTHPVVPCGVDPVPGTYEVVSRSARGTGSDGVPVEHVVRFASLGATVIGFSAALNGSTAPPPVETGGIRQTREDGRAMWEFAAIGRSVVVVG
ncbi:hypothetical protein GCM10027168_68190 [Streptomyces capparidis]